MELTAYECNQLIKDTIRKGHMACVYNAPLLEAQKSGCLYTKYIDDKLVCFAYGRRLKRRDIFVLDKIGIAPESRGQGYGTTIINKIKSEQGVPIRVDVSSKNTQALNFYLQNGFEYKSKKYIGTNKDIPIDVLST